MLDLYTQYIKPHADPKQLTVTFPDVFASLPGRKNRLADPFRIVLLKLIENNPTIQVLTPKVTAVDVANFHYSEVISKLKVYDAKRMCFIFVEHIPVVIDYSETSNWKHGPIRSLHKYGADKIGAAIKLNCDDSSIDKCPIPVFPFLYPGPNDYRDFSEFLEEDTYSVEYDVFSKITYSSDYGRVFLDCYHRDLFKHSITAYWGVPPFKAYRCRQRFSELAKQIPNSNIVEHVSAKSVSMEKYYHELCRSKFGISIRGSAKFSHREMELSSIGMPWFGEDRGQIFYKPFVPGEHYILVTPESFLDTFKYYNEHYSEALEIGLNAREYFHKWHRRTGLQLIFHEICKKIQESA